MKQGNHMVDLPQPELDKEVKCEHEDYVIEDLYELRTASTVLEVVCSDCGTMGIMIMYADDRVAEIEWDE